MSDKASTHVIRGKLDWAKVVGEPRMNPFTEGREWSVDVTPNPEGLKLLKSVGAAEKMKTPKESDSRKENYLPFRHRESRTDRDGNVIKNQPIKIIDAQGKPWDERLIGNGTIADVKFRYRDYGKGKPKGVYIEAIRILELVPFESNDFAPLSEDDEFFAQEEKETEGFDNTDKSDLDDEVPF